MAWEAPSNRPPSISSPIMSLQLLSHWPSFTALNTPGSLQPQVPSTWKALSPAYLMEDLLSTSRLNFSTDLSWTFYQRNDPTPPQPDPAGILPHLQAAPFRASSCSCCHRLYFNYKGNVKAAGTFSPITGPANRRSHS